jgi:hypothetical protein
MARRKVYYFCTLAVAIYTNMSLCYNMISVRCDTTYYLFGYTITQMTFGLLLFSFLVLN